MSKPGYEPRDLKEKYVYWTAAIVVGIFLVSYPILFGIMRHYTGDRSSYRMTKDPLSQVMTHLPAKPRLQHVPRQDLADYLSEQRKRLNSYGYVDGQAGTVHIPIERAMEILIERQTQRTDEKNHD